jgi:hypothetical protein
MNETITIKKDQLNAMINDAAKQIASLETKNESLRGMIDCTIPALDLLQTRLELGCEIKHQDGKWCLFDKKGECVCRGETIRKLLTQLVFVDL